MINAIDAGDLAPADATDEFNYACAEARWRQAQKRVPGLAELTHLDRHRIVKAFHDLESNRLTDIQTLLRSQHLAQLPQGAAGEMGIILGEIGRKRKHLPIRKLIDRAGTMVQRIKPVFLMSPISIAQFLPPGSLTFDLLVVDEASQVRPEDALGAIARVRQIVVVGDQKQLPPTSFLIGSVVMTVTKRRMKRYQPLGRQRWRVFLLSVKHVDSGGACWSGTIAPKTRLLSVSRT